jgi:hypothetical protein
MGIGLQEGVESCQPRRSVVVVEGDPCSHLLNVSLGVEVVGIEKRPT